MRRRSLLTLVAVAVLAAGCTQSELTIDAGDGRDPGVVRGDVVTDPDEVVELALDDLHAYWSEAIRDIYDVEFEPLAGGYVPYGPDTLLPRCAEEQLTYEQVADNALYCPTEDFIAWDRVGLVPELNERFGPLTVALVLAHEYAHAVQNRGDVRGATVALELQADCFAGAWVDDVDDRVATFATDADALDQAVAGLLELRDTLGMPSYDVAAHGSGFDRVSAFQDGFEGGAEVCAGYEGDPPTVVAIPWGANDIFGGNLPLGELREPLLADLESFFTALFAEQGQLWDPIDGLDLFDPGDGTIRCGPAEVPPDELELASFYCASDDTLYLDGDGLVPALEEIGDFAFGGEVARLYAFAAQDQLGLDGDAPEAEGLHADCVAGVFSSAEFLEQIPDQRLSLSPGDIDEVIIAFLAFGDDVGASAFERTAAFRAGFVEGFEACEPILG